MTYLYVAWVRVPGLTGDRYVATLRHDCSMVGDVELERGWRHCPWCGRPLLRARWCAERPHKVTAVDYDTGRTHPGQPTERAQ